MTRAVLTGVVLLSFGCTSSSRGGSSGASGGPGGANGARGGASGAPGGANGARGGASGGPGGAGGAARASVLQHHNHLSRDGLYVDPVLTAQAVMGTVGTSGGMQLDATFANAMVVGTVYGQPLYLAGSAGKPDLVLVATEANNVYAFDASNGAQVWTRSTETLGIPASNPPNGPLVDLPCGNISPTVGVTGTPVIDGATETIYLDALAVDTSTGVRVVEHRVHALDARTGDERSGWPVGLNGTVASTGATFVSSLQNQKGALTLLGGKVFVPFGGHVGDCGGYHGWVVGIATTGTPTVTAWATRAIAGGIWGASGIASDGLSLFFATGNSKSSAAASGNTSSGDGDGSWGDSETVFKFPTSLIPPALATTTDYFLPANWVGLDDADGDMGGTSPILVQVPGATPSTLLVALGKDHYAYLLDPAKLGGMDAAPLAKVPASGNVIITAAAAYTTSQGTYVVFRSIDATFCPSGQTGGLMAMKIAPTNPPTLSVAWCQGMPNSCTPAVSQTDDRGSNTIVWAVESDDKLHGHDGDTGMTVFDGGPTVLSPVLPYPPPIVANGRVFVTTNSQVYAFKIGSN